MTVGREKVSGRGKTEPFGEALLLTRVGGNLGDARVLNPAQDGLDSPKEHVVEAQQRALFFLDNTEGGRAG